MASGKARRVAGPRGSARGPGVKKILRPVREWNIDLGPLRVVRGRAADLGKYRAHLRNGARARHRARHRALRRLRLPHASRRARLHLRRGHRAALNVHQRARLRALHVRLRLAVPLAPPAVRQRRRLCVPVLGRWRALRNPRVLLVLYRRNLRFSALTCGLSARCLWFLLLQSCWLCADAQVRSLRRAHQPRLLLQRQWSRNPKLTSKHTATRCFPGSRTITPKR